MSYCAIFIADNSDWPHTIPKDEKFPFVVYKRQYGNYRYIPVIIDYCTTRKEAVQKYKAAVKQRDRPCAK